MSDVDVRAAATARAQFGVAHFRQLHCEAEISRGAISRRLEAGVWEWRIGRIIDVGTHPRSWHQAAWALVLAAGEGGVLSHRTAAHLHRLVDISRPRVPDVTVPRGRHDRVGSVRLHTTIRLAPEETVLIDGLPTTSAARTVVDLAPRVTSGWIDLALSDALRRRQSTRQQVLDAIALRPGFSPGRFVLRRLAALPTDIDDAESPLEVRGVLRLVELGMEPEVLQMTLRDGLPAPIRADAAWPTQRVIVEFDSSRWHDTRAEADRQRDRNMKAIGWHVVRIRQRDLDDPGPSDRIRELRRRLG